MTKDQLSLLAAFAEAKRMTGTPSGTCLRIEGQETGNLAESERMKISKMFQRVDALEFWSERLCVGNRVVYRRWAKTTDTVLVRES